MAPRAHPDAELTAREVAELHAALVAARRRLADPHRSSADEARASEPCFTDAGDAARFFDERHRSERLHAHQTDALAEIDRALAKLEDGTYGVCEATGLPIGARRLRALPWARRAVSAADDDRRPGKK